MAWIVAVDLCIMTLSLKILANKISLLSSAANDHTGFILFIILQKEKIFTHFYEYWRGIRLNIASFKKQTKKQEFQCIKIPPIWNPPITVDKYIIETHGLSLP